MMKPRKFKLLSGEKTNRDNVLYVSEVLGLTFENILNNLIQQRSERSIREVNTPLSGPILDELFNIDLFDDETE